MALPDTASPAGTGPDIFTGPVKRSMTIAGHPSSLSLEPPFWAALEAAAREHKLPLNALVARIDAARVDDGGGANLASVLRCWLLDRAQHPGTRGEASNIDTDPHPQN
ncbi:MAG TPA: ribbon-helix-helix domain-containing protein [Sphingobium sp.]